MRKLSAHYIFPVTGKPLHNGILITGDQGEIIDLVDTNGNLADAEKLEFYNGVIVPGFVNAHCHLELSHLKEKITRHTGLHGFIEQFVAFREADFKEIHNRVEIADFQMKRGGIVAVGDISNTGDTFFQKQHSAIKYHTFIEIFSPEKKYAENRFQAGMNLLNDAKNFYGLSVSLTPHAPYTMSHELLSLIRSFAVRHESIISIHNQETQSENEMFISKSGMLYDMLCRIGADYSEWIPTGRNSLESVMQSLPRKNRTLLVHNTFSGPGDYKPARSYFSDLYWCLCPNANIFIEDTLPDIAAMRDNGLKIVIGTDSLASNDKLSILSELQTINLNFPHIPFADLVQWATLNGAEALGFSSSLGSFEKGKTPGVNLIENVDLQNMRLTDSSTIKVLV